MLQPLNGNVLLQKEKEEARTASGIILSESKEKPAIAKVVAVGPGRVEDGKVIPMTVAPGDTVVYKKYTGTEFSYEHQDYLVVDEENILLVIK